MPTNIKSYFKSGSTRNAPFPGHILIYYVFALQYCMKLHFSNYNASTQPNSGKKVWPLIGGRGRIAFRILAEFVPGFVPFLYFLYKNFKYMAYYIVMSNSILIFDNSTIEPATVELATNTKCLLIMV